MDTSKEIKSVSKNNLYKLRKKKIEDQILSAKRILEQKIEPIEVAGRFLHESFNLMKKGISNRYPDLSEEEINQKIQKTLLLSEKLKKTRTRGKNYG
ncbi:MAG: hypothetical protein ACQERB_13570 [Promethearchaeati archaeon]